MNNSTSWVAVRERIKYRPFKNRLKAAEFHIKGLEWIIENVLPENVQWPTKFVRDMLIYIVFDKTKVRFKNYRNVLKVFADGAPVTYRGVIIPVNQTQAMANWLLKNDDWVMAQYKTVQKVLEKARKEQGGANRKFKE
jgi:hypothetical protein